MIYPSLAELLVLAELALGLPGDALRKVIHLGLAESALAVPAASFGGVEFYPDPSTKAAVLLAHLTWNHALPDGNKRTAWVVTWWFVEANGGRWRVELMTEDAAVELVRGLATHDFDELNAVIQLREWIEWPPEQAGRGIPTR